ncbi:MAG: SDR family oxidoreductase [Ignavibacteria bacterium]
MGQKVIWVSGASSGIGREIAKEFSKAGHKVAVTARRKNELMKLVKEIRSEGGTASAFICNVMSELSVKSAFKKITEDFGKVDCLINNAGTTVFKSFTDTNVSDYDNVIGTNLRGAFLCIKSVLPEMLKRKNGHIINVLSVAANTAFENSSVYAASKAGLLAMSNSLRAEVRSNKIKVSNILPGAVETEMWDKKSLEQFSHKMMQPKDIAMIVFNIFSQPEKVLIEDIIVRPVFGDL